MQGRWPTAWRITWTGPEGLATLNLTQSERHGIANWVIGGFSTGIVRGELDYAGQKHPVYGLAELLCRIRRPRILLARPVSEMVKTHQRT